jgi:hypothetical protein
MHSLMRVLYACAGGIWAGPAQVLKCWPADMPHDAEALLAEVAARLASSAYIKAHRKAATAAAVAAAAAAAVSAAPITTDAPGAEDAAAGAAQAALLAVMHALLPAAQARIVEREADIELVASTLIRWDSDDCALEAFVVAALKVHGEMQSVLCHMQVGTPLHTFFRQPLMTQRLRTRCVTLQKRRDGPRT